MAKGELMQESIVVLTPRQELRVMSRAARSVTLMGSAGRQWLLRWMRDRYPADWQHIVRNG